MFEDMYLPKIRKGQIVNAVHIDENGAYYWQFSKEGEFECDWEDILGDIYSRLPTRRILPKMLLWSIALGSILAFISWFVLIHAGEHFSDMRERFSNVNEWLTFFAIFFFASLFVTWPILHLHRKKKETIYLYYDISPEKEQEIQDFYDACSSLAESEKVWHKYNENYHGDPKRHSGTMASISRSDVTIYNGYVPKIHTNIDIMTACMGGLIVYFFPDAIYYTEYGELCAIPYEDLEITICENQFRESQHIPSDAEVLGHVWKYVNADGGPDRRFNDNRRIPVLKYRGVKIEDNDNFSLEFLVSNFEIGGEFANALHRYIQQQNQRG